MAMAMHWERMNWCVGGMVTGWHNRENMAFMPGSVSHELPFCPLPAVCSWADTMVMSGRCCPSAIMRRRWLLVESVVWRWMCMGGAVLSCLCCGKMCVAL